MFEAIRKINKQIELEKMACAIYGKLEECAESEDVRSLWRKLSVHEQYHVAALERLKNTLAPDELAQEAFTLDEAGIEALLVEYNDIMKEVSGGVSKRRAFELAITMEFSELNSLFSHAAEKDEDDLSPLIHSMAEGTKSHLQVLYRGIMQCLEDGEELPCMEKFRELGISLYRSATG